MRLDKFLGESGMFSRKEAGIAVRSGRITVDGVIIRDPSQHIADTAEVNCDGKPVHWSKYQYILLNKPQGVISASEEGSGDHAPTVMSLLPESCRRLGMFPCGRLDRDTTGLLLITNDGPNAHRWLSPRHHVPKVYRYHCAPALSPRGQTMMESGMDLGDFTSKPAIVRPDTSRLSGEIVLTEGKFHQIKRMFHAAGSEITSLERITFGPLTLDPFLSPGEWRYLTDTEIAALLTWSKNEEKHE